MDRGDLRFDPPASGSGRLIRASAEPDRRVGKACVEVALGRNCRDEWFPGGVGAAFRDGE